MANFDKIVSHLLIWEAGLNPKYKELPLPDQYEKARKTGLANDPDDLGGLTMVGITYKTFATYCKRKGIEPTPERLKEMDYTVWRDILKTMFWDIWKADKIDNQTLAAVVVDWFINSGYPGIKIPQRLLGLKEDGIVGPMTLGALNGYADPELLFGKLIAARRDYYNEICRRNPRQKKFLNGWLNRVNSFRYES